MRDEVRWFFWECAGKKKGAKGAKAKRENLEHHYQGSFVACPLLAERLQGTEEGLTQRREGAKVGLNFVGSIRDEVEWFFGSVQGRIKARRGQRRKGES